MRFLQLSVVQGCAASRGLCCLGRLWPRCLAAGRAVLALCLQVCSPPLCISGLSTFYLFWYQFWAGVGMWPVQWDLLEPRFDDPAALTALSRGLSLILLLLSWGHSPAPQGADSSAMLSVLRFGRVSPGSAPWSLTDGGFGGTHLDVKCFLSCWLCLCPSTQTTPGLQLGCGTEGREEQEPPCSLVGQRGPARSSPGGVFMWGGAGSPSLEESIHPAAETSSVGYF